jgi:hypothetical protein
VWLGRGIPGQLLSVAPILGLTVEQTRDPARIGANAADLFAVIVSGISHDNSKALGRLLRLAKTMHILDYGVLLAVACPDRATSIRLRRLLIQTLKDPELEKAPITPIGVRDLEFAEALRLHQAGPATNPNLQVTGHDRRDEHYESDSILLNRAFRGFNGIRLTQQTGGFSNDSRIWRIDARHPRDPTLEPFVAKTGRTGDLEEEFRTYCDFVRNTIRFPFRAPLLEAQFVKGGTRAILVSAFVNRSERLDKYLANVSSPELVMVSLFEEALVNWRRAATRERMSLAKASLLLPNPTNLTEAFKVAREHSKRLPTPLQLCHQLLALPKDDHYICRVHGDLNIRNIFVRWNTTDTILIDFSQSGNRGSLARDPSRLDTSIGLTAGDTNQKLLSEKVLRMLYRSPLLPPRNVVPVDGRTDAIRQIRRHAGGEGISNREYEILTICHLLRFACNPVLNIHKTAEMRKRRGLCYRLACNLSDNL